MTEGIQCTENILFFVSSCKYQGVVVQRKTLIVRIGMFVDFILFFDCMLEIIFITISHLSQFVCMHFSTVL